MFIYSIIRTLFHAQPVVFCFPWIVILVAGVLGCHHFCWWKWHRRNRKVNANNVASGSSKTGFQCMFLCSIYLLLKVFGHANFAAVFCPSHRCLLFFFCVFGFLWLDFWEHTWFWSELERKAMLFFALATGFLCNLMLFHILGCCIQTLSRCHNCSGIFLVLSSDNYGRI